DLATGRALKSIKLPTGSQLQRHVPGPGARSVVQIDRDRAQILDGATARPVGRPIALEGYRVMGTGWLELGRDDVWFRGDGTIVSVLDNARVHMIDVKTGLEAGPPLMHPAGVTRAGLHPARRPPA